MKVGHLNARLSQLEDTWKTGNVKIWIMEQAVSSEEEQRSIDLDKVSDFGPGRALAPPKNVEFTSGI